MDAVFSGQAATIAFLEGAEARVHRQSNVDFTIAREGVSYLFHGCNDVVALRGTKEESARAHYQVAWEADRSLRLTLILIDGEEETDLREEAADFLEAFLANSNVQHFVENELYSRTLPQDADLELALASKRWPRVAQMLQEVVDQQPAIRERRTAWDQIASGLFDKLDKIDFEERAIRLGAFRVLASADLNNIDRNLAILECHRVLKSLPNARAIVSEWTKEFIRKGVTLVILPEENDEAILELPVVALDARRAHSAYTNAIQQQKAIVEKVRTGSTRLARKYAEELVASQLRSGGSEFVAKSLCSLAQEAKYLGLFSLQLEWAQQAADICPDDAWAHGQFADALLGFSRLDEALAEIDLCEANGDHEFAVTARARVLRHQGRLGEALAAFRAARVQFAEGPSCEHAWLGSAETLREMWRLEEALSEYIAAIKRFPDNNQLRCGYAAVLSDLGRFEEALEAYNIPQCHDDVVALNGTASALRDMGRIDEALDVIGRAIELFPTEPYSRCIKADILKVMGDLQASLQVYAVVKASNPSVAAAFSGFAEILREMRRMPEAIAAYEEAVKLFPFEPRLANGYANIRRANDELEQALALYEGNVRRFPYDLISKAGRADLLKRLGQYDDALMAYDEIMTNWPAFASARNGKAAILVALGNFVEAQSLLPSNAPSTRDDWISSHIQGMILLRQERFDEAIEHFALAAKETPFARERRYFDRALSIARMRRGNFQEAVAALEEAGGGLSNVLRLHALAAAGELDRAKNSYRELTLKCPSQLIDLRDAIASRFHISERISHHNDNWIFNREAEALLREAA